MDVTLICLFLMIMLVLMFIFFRQAAGAFDKINQGVELLDKISRQIASISSQQRDMARHIDRAQGMIGHLREHFCGRCFDTDID